MKFNGICWGISAYGIKAQRHVASLLWRLSFLHQLQKQDKNLHLWKNWIKFDDFMIKKIKIKTYLSLFGSRLFSVRILVFWTWKAFTMRCWTKLLLLAYPLQKPLGPWSQKEIKANLDVKHCPKSLSALFISEIALSLVSWWLFK